MLCFCRKSSLERGLLSFIFLICCLDTLRSTLPYAMITFPSYLLRIFFLLPFVIIQTLLPPSTLCSMSSAVRHLLHLVLNTDAFALTQAPSVLLLIQTIRHQPVI